jgi:hypothetical protein
MTEIKTLTDKDIAFGATNAPALSSASFTLGDRTFKLVHLEYDAYLAFVTLLTPLFEFAQAASGIGTEALSPKAVIQYCGADLPELVKLVCSQTDPSITVEEVKRLGKNPLVLAAVVLKQVEHNEMIKDFADFFGQILPLIQAQR